MQMSHIRPIQLNGCAATFWISHISCRVSSLSSAVSIQCVSCLTTLIFADSDILDVKRLTVHTLTQIVFSPYLSNIAKRAKIINLLKVIKSWKAWDDISAMTNHQIIKSHLLTCLRLVDERHETRYDLSDVRFLSFDNLRYASLTHKKTVQMALARILKIDAISIDALLLETLQDRAKYKQLVKRRGREAQSLLNLLQAVCPL
jgi:hypothetical protein